MFGGFLGVDDTLLAVLQLDVNHKCFILDVDKEAQQQASGFCRDHRPAMADTAGPSRCTGTTRFRRTGTE
ncbi:MAG: hypothetical protein WBG17_15130 [Burkholderiaceae bacterium]